MRFLFVLIPLLVLGISDLRSENASCNKKSRQNTQNSNDYGEINTASFLVLIQSQVPLVILDARTGEEDDGKRIPGAKSLSPDASIEKIEALIPSKNSLIVVYGLNGKCPPCGQLAEHLISLGYPNVLKYIDGLNGWVAAGLGTERENN